MGSRYIDPPIPIPSLWILVGMPSFCVESTPLILGVEHLSMNVPYTSNAILTGEGTSEKVIVLDR